MKTSGKRRTAGLTVGLLGGWLAAAAAAAGPDTLDDGQGRVVGGRLTFDATAGLAFAPDGDGPPVPLRRGMAVKFPAPPARPTAGFPPFHADLGLGQRVSGRLESIDDGSVVLIDPAREGRLRLDRNGVAALLQRPGEALELLDGFESLDAERWSVTGEPALDETRHFMGAGSVRIPAGGSSLTYRLAEPFAAGRLELAFHDDGAVVAGRKWYVDLLFRGPGGLETVRSVLGWSEESLAVESPSGPALAVQRLARVAGWRRLAVRFGPSRCEVAVDGNELAHGKGLGGPLVEVRIVTTGGDAAAGAKLAGHVDDLRLVRFTEPSGEFEVDASQDEVRLSGGDQVFGQVLGAGPDQLRARIDGREVAFTWGEVAGVYFRRVARPGAPVSGPLVRVEWRPAAGAEAHDLDALEGAVAGLDKDALTLDTPYLGRVVVARDRLASLRGLGRGTRLVLDPTSHHLGDETSTSEPRFDPPQPEGGVLERTFTLAKPPEGTPYLVLDVLQVVGEASDLPFANLVKKGELRTNVALNGVPFDYLNRYIASKNETPERIRIPLPKGGLRVGKNTLRFEQVGIASDPNYLDDLGVLGIALEFETAGRPPGAR